MKIYHLFVWSNVSLGHDSSENFEQAFLDHNIHIKFADTFFTLPDMENGDVVANTGGRSEILFYVDSDDLYTFLAPMLDLRIRFWDNALAEECRNIYPKEIIDKYNQKAILYVEDDEYD